MTTEKKNIENIDKKNNIENIDKKNMTTKYNTHHVESKDKENLCSTTKK